MSQQQAMMNEANYYFTIQDLTTVIKEHGAKMVLKDLMLLAPDQYEELVTAVLATETVVEF